MTNEQRRTGIRWVALSILFTGSTVLGVALAPGVRERLAELADAQRDLALLHSFVDRLKQPAVLPAFFWGLPRERIKQELGLDAPLDAELRAAYRPLHRATGSTRLEHMPLREVLPVLDTLQLERLLPDLQRARDELQASMEACEECRPTRVTLSGAELPRAYDGLPRAGPWAELVDAGWTYYWSLEIRYRDSTSMPERHSLLGTVDDTVTAREILRREAGVWQAIDRLVANFRPDRGTTTTGFSALDPVWDEIADLTVASAARRLERETIKAQGDRVLVGISIPGQLLHLAAPAILIFLGLTLNALVVGLRDTPCADRHAVLGLLGESSFAAWAVTIIGLLLIPALGIAVALRPFSFAMIFDQQRVLGVVGLIVFIGLMVFTLYEIRRLRSQQPQPDPLIIRPDTGP